MSLSFLSGVIDGDMRRVPLVLVAGLVPVAGWLIAQPFLAKIELPVLSVSAGFAIFAFIWTAHLIPLLGPVFVRANLKGRDLLKPGSTVDMSVVSV